MILIKIGIIVQAFVAFFAISNKLEPYIIVSSISMALAHIGVLFYGYLGYKKGKVPYFITLGLFLVAIVVNIIIPYRDIPQRILLTLLFGVMCMFPFKQDNYKFTNIIIFIAALLSLGYSIYSTIVANPNNLGEAAKVFPEIVLYLSLYAPVILVGLFGAAYNARYEKTHPEEPKAE